MTSLLFALVRRPLKPARRLHFPGLAGDAFMHPWDLRSIRKLEQSTLLQRASDLLLPVVNARAREELQAKGTRVSQRAYPKVYAALCEAVKVLDTRQPDVFVRQNPTPNAYAFASWQTSSLRPEGTRPFIVLTSGLLDILDDGPELQSVVAHELGHIKCDHARFMCMAQLIGNFLGLFGGPAAAETHRRALLQWQRCAELSSDRCALLVVQDEDVVIRALEKLSRRPPRIWERPSKSPAEAPLRLRSRIGAPASMLRHRDAWLRLRSGDVLALMDIVAQTGKTHPELATRVKHIAEYAESPEYARLLLHGAV